MSDSDRQVYFADFVIELQAAEDDKRRRIRDARRRAEKAQREAYRDTLRSMAASGILLPSTRWRSVEDIVSTHSTYPPVHDQDREAPRELFEDFIEEWNEVYRRDRALLAGLVHPASNKDILVTGKTTFDEFTRALLQEASYSPEVHADIRHIINHNDPVSSALVYFNELTAKANENSLSVPRARRSSILRTTSEDEGEVVEEGEVTELDALVEAQSVDQPAEPPGGGDENSNPAASNAELTEGQA
jgi:pre-mRNA-processing factor 40